MSRNVEEAAEHHDRVIWQAKPTGRAVVGELLAAVLISGAFVVLFVVVPGADPVEGLARDPPARAERRAEHCHLGTWGALFSPGTASRYVECSPATTPGRRLLSLTVEDDGRIEITPKGWVRKLPIPQDEVPEAFAVITRWREAARART